MLTPATSIRQLFLEPQPTYTLPEATALLGMSWRDLRDWIDGGELEGVDTEDGIRLPWAEMVSFGMDFWSLEVVEEALRAEVAEAIPELLRLARLEVRIPRMEIVALGRMGAREGKSVDAVLARELLDLVSAQSEWLADEIPGFAEAFRWPEGE